MITFKDLASIVKGEIIQLSSDREIKYISIDSRKSLPSPNTLFFAIKGERHNGHDYLERLAEDGITQFVIEEEIQINLENCNVVKVTSSVEALQEISLYKREQFQNPLIAITGSSGKTIIKEWMFQLLRKDHNVYRSPKSYNSQVGVPLSLWRLNKYQELAFIEAGISLPGEMEKLERIIKPDIGLFTNLGPPHDDGFKDRKEKAHEKALLFKNCKKVIYCADHNEVKEAVEELHVPEYFAWTAGNNEADLKVIPPEKEDTTLKCIYKSEEFEIELPGTDKATLQNAAHCLALLLSLDFQISDVKRRFSDLTPVSMRLELKRGINGCYLINDTYNNDLGGIEIALDFLDHQSLGLKKTVMLSDILNSGLPEKDLYSQVADLMKRKKVQRFIGVGEKISQCSDLFPETSLFYDSTEDILNSLNSIPFDNEVILVKGARPFFLERIVQKLQAKIHNTVLEINLDRLNHNLNFFRSKLKPDVEIMIMVKAFAYGSGMIETARWLQYHRVDYLAVAYADEGVALRNNGVELPIMVMNPAIDSFDTLIAYNLEPEIYSTGILTALSSYLQKRNIKIKIHIKLDTGMHRLGFMESETKEVAKIIAESKLMEIESVFTHLAAQEDRHLNEFTLQQVSLFNEMYDEITGHLDHKPKRHVLNSAGITRFPEFHFDRVRLGIGLYGVDPDPEIQKRLQPISTFKTIISQIRSLKKDETVGYSRRGKTNAKTRIATIPVGYADGFDRRFSNGIGYVLINDQKAPVIGNICMDMTMIDLGNIEAKEGDEVILFGMNHSITELAEQIGTIPYEILTNVGERVKRIFISES